MSKKVVLGISLFIWSAGMIAVGAVISFFAFTALEFNDRLKYEAAYLKGYVKTQKALKENEHDKAELLLDFYIDSHVKTLSDFSYLSSSQTVIDIDEVLCEAIKLREDHKPDRSGESEEVKDWYKEIDQYLESKGWQCST